MSAIYLAWEFHRKELDSLKSLSDWTASDCRIVQAVVEALQDDYQAVEVDMMYGAYSDDESRWLYFEEFKYLITPVAIPFSCPRRSEHPDNPYAMIWTGTDSYDSAHEAAVSFASFFFGYLRWKYLKWLEKLPFTGTDDDCLKYAWKEYLWQEARNELKPLCEFDFDALAGAIEKEHQLASDRCRALVLGSLQGTTPGSVANPDSGTGLFPAIPKSPKPSISRNDGGENLGTQTIENLERVTPPLDREDGKWVNNKRAAILEGFMTETLGTYRKSGIQNSDKTLGCDQEGRIWRRNGTPKSHPWYLRSTLLTEQADSA
jgi:hypothetical protein